MKDKITLVVMSVVLLGVLILGCGTKAVEPAYAGALTDNILTAINDGNYQKFSRDLNQTMLNALPETAFNQLAGGLKSKIGDYVSKQFKSVTVQNGITTVIYNAKYTISKSVAITRSFQTVSGRDLIAGLYFNAPELQQ